MIDHAYDCVFKSFSKRKQKEIEAEIKELQESKRLENGYGDCIS